MLTTESKVQKAYTNVPEWVSLTILVDGGIVESFTDSATDMDNESPKRVPVPNGAATTRSFLAAGPPFALSGAAGGARGVSLSALPAGVRCGLDVADLVL